MFPELSENREQSNAAVLSDIAWQTTRYISFIFKFVFPVNMVILAVNCNWARVFCVPDWFLTNFLVSGDCCVALPRGAIFLSAVCYCGISRSYSLTIYNCSKTWQRVSVTILTVSIFVIC